MLKWISIDQPAQCHQLFEHFESLNPTWIVGDLRSKFLIQEKLLQKHGGFEDENVFRANEYWQLLYKKIKPQRRIVSQDYLEAFLKYGPLSSVFSELSPTAVRSLFSELEAYLPIFFNPQGVEILRDWFLANSQSYQKWGGRLEYLGSIFNVLKDQNIMSRSWLAVALAQEFGFESYVQRPLVVDLGADLSQSEVDILVTLSRVVDVHVLVPEPHWGKDFNHLLTPYRYLERKFFDRKMKASELLKKETVADAGLSNFVKLSSQLAEVKHATGTVRKWLQSGISPKEISVVAPDIELYWPALQSYLQQEGIPANKQVVVKFHTLPDIGRWLSFLRILAQKIKFTDLEMATVDLDKMKFSEFKSIFKTLIDKDDLYRDQSIATLFTNANSTLDKDLTCIEFLAQAISSYRGFEDLDLFKQIADGFIQSCHGLPPMKFGAWQECLEKHLSQKERVVFEANADGINVVNLQSGDVIRSSYRIFLGQSEEQMRNVKKHQISSEEAFHLAKDTGFYFEDVDQGSKGFDIRWVSSTPCHEQMFFYAMSDFEGSLQNPSLFFLENFLLQQDVDHETPIAPMQTRWDHVQSLAPVELATFRSMDEQRANGMLRAIELERELDLNERLVIDKKWKLSPSSIESYGQCPFKFKVEKIFNLYDPSAFDVDLDQRETGTIAHSIFEKLIENQIIRSDVSLQELQSIVESAIQKHKPDWVTSPWYKGTINKYLKIAQSFIVKEVEWFKRFSAARVVGIEVPFEFFYDLDQKKISAVETQNSIKVTGKIDRIEEDGAGHIAVVDYKTSDKSRFNQNKWLSSQELQLGIYAFAVQKEFCKQIPSGEVVQAVYYAYKDLKREKGFMVTEADGSFYEIGKRRSAPISLQQKSELLEKIEKHIGEIAESIVEGKFAAKPIDPENTCKKCNWKKICRAPHLS